MPKSAFAVHFVRGAWRPAFDFAVGWSHVRLGWGSACGSVLARSRVWLGLDGVERGQWASFRLKLRAKGVG
eukprot:3517502-Rhodomonas_salina.1